MNAFLNNRTHNQELALFVGQGMLEWLKVWSKCAPSKPAVKDRNEGNIDFTGTGGNIVNQYGFK
jgi:hypothetical protein